VSLVRDKDTELRAVFADEVDQPPRHNGIAAEAEQKKVNLLDLPNPSQMLVSILSSSACRSERAIFPPSEQDIPPHRPTTAF
jgi:hypothetical protein